MIVLTHLHVLIHPDSCPRETPFDDVMRELQNIRRHQASAEAAFHESVIPESLTSVKSLPLTYRGLRSVSSLMRRMHFAISVFKSGFDVSNEWKKSKWVFSASRRAF